MSILIKNGRVITAVDDYKADIFIEDEKISVIGKNLQMNADKIIDAKGKVFACEILDNDCIGSLRENNMDFMKLWNGKTNQRLRKFIKDCEPGMDMSCSFGCENCGHTNNSNIPITTEFFWPST